ncbi:hypothetical protein [Pseudomonas aeruginosa]|uniref:hypothetical protein n=1 Tax=Pseudomonas aeruginosa TaxID=287 RepID=UPI00053E287B|nr:hypothetical protein [Pseudomonas aeruginosa]EKW2385971.1 hypothetical protein [Pseudomonas aeruginosa]MBW6276214.1 hypothetical protein [Pseudomonas aeruginosa]MCD2789626.1 hypothetical protein [Pseudomonas aeruginosa]MCD2845936.1 hypothetical protein [Pseudomonas aeruginosa]MCD2870164.1 hypothetical protein [Pseudomonas aeruginosa]
MIYRGFRIENERAYIWRTYCWGSHAGHNWVACWYVYDAHGKRVAGGYDSGNNTRSGSAHMARRKDAKAWVDGYHAYRDEPENRKTLGNGYIVHAPTYCNLRNERDDNAQAWFEHGYQQSQRK